MRPQVWSLHEHLPNLSRKAIGKAGWIWRGFVFWGNFPTRLIDIGRLHQKKCVFSEYAHIAHTLLERSDLIEHVYNLSRIMGSILACDITKPWFFVSRQNSTFRASASEGEAGEGLGCLVGGGQH